MSPKSADDRLFGILYFVYYFVEKWDFLFLFNFVEKWAPNRLEADKEEYFILINWKISPKLADDR